MKDQKSKKAADFLGLNMLSTLDERLIVGGAMDGYYGHTNPVPIAPSDHDHDHGAH